MTKKPTQDEQVTTPDDVVQADDITQDEQVTTPDDLGLLSVDVSPAALSQVPADENTDMIAAGNVVVRSNGHAQEYWDGTRFIRIDANKDVIVTKAQAVNLLNCYGITQVGGELI